MKKIISTAKCRFCGQLVQLDGDCELTEEQAEERAAMLCKCAEAVGYQKIRKRKEKALKNISLLFGEKAAPEKRIDESLISILEKAAEEICSENMEKISLNLWGGVKASVSKTAKGEINVERTETKKRKLTE